MKITTQTSLHHIILFVLLVRYSLGPIPWLQKETQRRAAGQAQAQAVAGQQSNPRGGIWTRPKSMGTSPSASAGPDFTFMTTPRAALQKGMFFFLKQASVVEFRFSQGQPLFHLGIQPKWQRADTQHTAGARQNACPTFLPVDGGVPLTSSTQAELMTSFLAASRVCVSFAWLLGLDRTAAIAASEKHFKHSCLGGFWLTGHHHLGEMKLRGKPYVQWVCTRACAHRDLCRNRRPPLISTIST